MLFESLVFPKTFFPLLSLFQIVSLFVVKDGELKTRTKNKGVVGQLAIFSVELE